MEALRLKNIEWLTTYIGQIVGKAQEEGLRFLMFKEWDLDIVYHVGWQTIVEVVVSTANNMPAVDQISLSRSDPLKKDGIIVLTIKPQ